MSQSRKYWRKQLIQAAIALPILITIMVLTHFETAFGCVISGIFILLAAVMIGQTLWMSRSGQVAQGTTVDHEIDEDCFFPVVEFRDRKSNTRRERTDCGRGVRSPTVGSRVVVMYDSKGMLECQIVSFGARRATPFAVSTVGFIILAAVLMKG